MSFFNRKDVSWLEGGSPSPLLLKFGVAVTMLGGEGGARGEGGDIIFLSYEASDGASETWYDRSPPSFTLILGEGECYEAKNVSVACDKCSISSEKSRAVW